MLPAMPEPTIEVTLCIRSVTDNLLRATLYVLYVIDCACGGWHRSLVLLVQVMHCLYLCSRPYLMNDGTVSMILD